MRRRFRVIRGGLDPADAARQESGEAADPTVTRRLRSAYAAPGEGYWDNLEATIMAAVRAGRAAPAAAAEWWMTLARWARPGLAAAAVLIGVIGGAYLQTRGASVDSASGSILELPAFPLEPLDEEFARATDMFGSDTTPAGREARAAAELLTDGVKRRPPVNLDLEPNLPSVAPTAIDDAGRDTVAGDSVRARRKAAFRNVVP